MKIVHQTGHFRSFKRWVSTIILLNVAVLFCLGSQVAAATLVTSNVSPGWVHNKQHNAFYNGQNYFLIYTDSSSHLLFKASSDNVTWSAQDTLVSDYFSLFNTFDIYLVNDSTFDLIYPESSNQYARIRTCTISGQTISCDSGSTPEALSWFDLSVARTQSNDRIFAVGTTGGGLLRVYSADQTGAAAGVTSWTGEVTSEESYITGTTAITPYSSSDKVLVIYQRNPGGPNADGIYSRAITRSGGAGTRIEIGNLSAVGVLSSAIRVSDTDFRYILSDNGVAPAEYVWNDATWSGPTTFANAATQYPALNYDRTNDDLYVFAVDTVADDVMRYKKPSGSGWDAGTIADGGEATLHTLPVTQMHEPPGGSGRLGCEVVWAYRVDNSGNFDLYMGNLNTGACGPALNGIVVDTTNDVSDGDTLSFAALNANMGADGRISLREAILAANNNPNIDGNTPDTIYFEIPAALVGGAHTITPSAALPNIADPVVIDGTTDADFSGAPIIELDGNSAGAGIDGLRLTSGSDGTTIRGFIINRFTESGIEITGSSDNVIAGNYIGTDITGILDRGNTINGILVINGARDNTIGGSNAVDRNVISGNDNDGLKLEATAGKANLVVGNYIGVDATGLDSLGNGGSGLDIQADSTIAGDTLSAGRNVISCNGNNGVAISGDSITIWGNYIGTNASGDSDFGNGARGIRIFGTSANKIGGTESGAGNVISGNGQSGIRIEGATGTDNIVQGNIVGLNAAGTAAVGNAAEGIEINSGSNNTIGGNSASARNVISGNSSRGVDITAATATGNKIQGNYIGLNLAGDALIGNGTEGIMIWQDASQNSVGGTGPSEGNVIAGNQYGIVVEGTSTDQNPILNNSIYSNDSLGIDLIGDGVTDNDGGDGDSGPNNLQNFPVLDSAITNGIDTVVVYGSLNSRPDSSFRIQFFVSDSADPLNNGEGEIFLGDTTVTTNGSGDIIFSSTFLASVTAGQVIAATATDANNNTSEFSDTLLVQAQGPTVQSNFKVGSFTKSTNTSVPVSQVIPHGLGETPKAIILWTNGKTNESMSSDYLFGWGVTDGTTDKSMANASAGLGLRSRSYADKALTVVIGNEITLAEADLSSWDATNFTLSWTTNNSTGYVIHFIAIGGSDVSAKVKEWTMPTSTGDQAVSGVGFTPDVVIHSHLGSGFTTAAPSATTGGGFGLGVMDVNNNEWALARRTAPSGNPSRAARVQQTDACLIWTDVGATSVPAEASFVSMDTDGFTTNFSTVSGNAAYVVSLALKGIDWDMGSFSKSTNTTTPASQPVTGLGVAPKALLLTSFQDVTQASPVDHDRFGIGASDGTTEGSSALQDTDNKNPDIVDGIDKTSKVFVKIDNDTQTIDAEADLTSLDSDGFTLSWTTNDAVATEILYLALGSAPSTTLSVVVSNSTFGFGVNLLNQWLTADSSFVINDGSVAENFVGQISILTDGSNNWSLSNTTNGADSVRAQWSTTSATGPWTDISAYANDFTIATNVAVSDTVTFYFRIQTPTSTSSFNEYSSTLTVTALEY